MTTLTDRPARAASGSPVRRGRRGRAGDDRRLRRSLRRGAGAHVAQQDRLWRTLWTPEESPASPCRPRRARSSTCWLAPKRRPRAIVEFGTSFGISSLHLAAALRDNGGGKADRERVRALEGRARPQRQLEGGRRQSRWWRSVKATRYESLSARPSGHDRRRPARRPQAPLTRASSRLVASRGSQPGVLRRRRQRGRVPRLRPAQVRSPRLPAICPSRSPDDVELSMRL